MGESGQLRGHRVRVDDLLGSGGPRATIEEQQALASLENRLFGARARSLTLSRYVLLERIGAGGLGMVYAAYDPQLDRKVAVKLLQARGDDDGEGADRLLREAQAMARVSHPNVIAVHDVGAYSEHELWLEPGFDAKRMEIPARGVFVVMELVEGETLAEAFARRISWREGARATIAAGRGLAAAHAAGLVHRDFKPANVLMGRDGRVRVLDFGLARAAGAARVQNRHARVCEPDDLQASLTRTGALMGTPAYMSPEQHRGAVADERSDQYGFGVVLYEAVYGTRPFAGTLNAIREAKHSGRWARPRPGTNVPTRVLAVIERALSPAPSDRFPSMDALLAAADRAVSPKPRSWLLGAVAASIVGLGAALALPLEADDPCDGADVRTEGLWNDERAARLAQAFAATDLSYADRTWTVASTEIHAHLEQWTAMYRDACEATHVRHEQSAQVLDRRMTCLRRALGEVEALLEVFEDADADTVENAVVATKSLSTLQTCADTRSSTFQAPAPVDAADRATVEALRSSLQDARIKRYVARYDEALRTASDVAARAEALAYAPLLAEARLEVGAIEERRGAFAAAERNLLEAVWTAESVRHEQIAADAWIRLVWVTGVERKQPEQGQLWARFAEAAVSRAGDDRSRRAMLTHHLGGVYYTKRDFAAAYAHYSRALDEQLRLLGDEDPAVARTLNHIGNVLMEQGRLEESHASCERSLKIRESVLGSDHPLVAASLNNLGSVRHRQGRHEEALAFADRALSITRGSGGPEEVITWRLIRMVAKNQELPKRLSEARARLDEIDRQNRTR